MELRNKGVALCFIVALAGIAACTSNRFGPDNQPAAGAGMQAVAVAARPGEAAHGWQYFSDVRDSRAVVISPGGDYYYSEGDGMKLVARAAGAA